MRNNNHNGKIPGSILIIGAFPASLTFITGILSSESFITEITVPGNSFFNSIINHPHALIILDTNLQGADCIDICLTIKKNEVTKNSPVVFVAEKETGLCKANYYEAGAADYILVPVNEKEFSSRIRMHIQSALQKIQQEEKINELSNALTKTKSTELELRISEDKFRSFVENAYDVVFSINPQGILTYVSPNVETVLGNPAHHYIGKLVFDHLIYQDDVASVLDSINKALETKNKQKNVEYRVFHNDGSLRWITTNASPIFDADGNMISIMGVARNITDEKNAAEALSISEQAYFNLFNSVTEAIYILDKDGIFIDVNKSAEKMYGYSREEIIGNTPELLSLPGQNSSSQVVKLISHIYKGNDLGMFEIWGRKKNGETFPKELFCKKGKYFGKEVLIVTARDITERKKMLKKLKESEEKFSKVFHLSPDPILLTRVEDGTIVDANERALILGGYEREEIVEKKAGDLHLWKTNKERDAFVAMLKTGGRIIDLEKDTIKKNGEKGYATLSADIITINREKYILTVIHEITDKKKAEREVMEKVTQLQILGDNLPDAMIYQVVKGPDEKMIFTYLSKGVEKITGMQPEFVLQQPDLLYSLILVEDRPVMMKALESSYSNMSFIDVEIRMKCFTGEVRWFQVRSAPRKLTDGRTLWDGVQIDITEKKLAAEKLQESETRWQFALDSARQGVWDWNAETDKVFYSPYWKAMLGYEDEEIADTVEEWDKRLHPDDKENVYTELDKHHKGLTAYYQSEHRLKCKDGTYKWILDVGKIVSRSQEGKVLRMIGTHTDITNRKKAEEALRKTVNELSDYKYALDQSANISITDEKGIIKYVNENFCRQYGYTSEEVIGVSQNILDSGYHPASFWNSYQSTIQNGKVLKAEVCNVAKDGTRYWADTIVVPFISNEGKPYQYLSIRTDITDKRRLEKELSEQQLHNQRLITEITIQEQENERKHISNELHENINQVLAAAKIYIGIVQMKSPVPDAILEKSYNSINQAMDLINRLSSSLVTPLLKDFGLLKVLEELTEEINKTNTLHVTLKTASGNIDKIDSGQMLMLYRLVQIQLGNIIKHAAAKNAYIHLNSDDQKIHLNIEDDGRGFDTTISSKGFGLIQIKNRVEFYSGSLSVISSPGNGCRLEITIPANMKKFAGKVQAPLFLGKI